MKRALLAFFLLTFVLIANACAGTAPAALPPKLLTLHHQYYDHEMQGAVELGWPNPITINGFTPQAVETFPDPVGSGNVTYQVIIINVTNEGITFAVTLSRAGMTYHLTTSGLQKDDGVQIQLPDKSGNYLLQTANEAQFAVAGPIAYNKRTGEVVVWIQFTYQAIWKWKQV